MDARSKLDEYATLNGWDKNKLIGWSEAADFGEWLVKNCNTLAVSNNEVAVCEKKNCTEPVYEFGLCFKHYCISEEH